MHRRTFLTGLTASTLATPALAKRMFTSVETQFIAALAGPGETHGTNAHDWGLWALDPGPRGVWLSIFPALAATGIAPAGWRYDPQEWWLEEHGLIMEKPQFPLAPATYIVTGGREVTTTLTVTPPDASGAQSWSLATGTIADVTHLACRAAVYTPEGHHLHPRRRQPLQLPRHPRRRNAPRGRLPQTGLCRAVRGGDGVAPLQTFSETKATTCCRSASVWSSETTRVRNPMAESSSRKSLPKSV